MSKLKDLIVELIFPIVAIFYLFIFWFLFNVVCRNYRRKMEMKLWK